jgi:gliding motility-associated-like protein
MDNMSQIHSSMKKIVALLGFALAAQLTIWGQGPSFNFSSVVGDTGTDVCVKITVKDFTDITSLKFPIRWDSTILEFKEVRVSGQLRDLDVSDFNTSRTKSGLLFLNWSPGPCNSNNSITLNDFVTIFEVCFKVIGKYGQATSVGLSEDRAFIGDLNPIIIGRFSGSCISIGYNPESIVGDVAVGVRPIRLFATEASGSTGEIVFISVKVSGFSQMVSAQFSVNYDTTLLEFANVLPLEALPNLSASSFGLPNDPTGRVGKGNVTVTWTSPNLQNNRGITLKDSTIIFQLSFKIIGPCGSPLAAVSFSDTPTKREAINESTVTLGTPIPIIGTTTYIEINACDPPGLKLAVDCGPRVRLNQEVCVKVTAPQGMNNINKLNFLTEWNANALQFVRVDMLSNKIPGLDNSSFNTVNVANGVLGLDWSPRPTTASATLSPGEVLYAVCFKAVGLSGTITNADSTLAAPVQLNRNTALITQRNNILNLGLAPSNCAVQIIQPAGVRVVLSSKDGKPGDEVCTDVTVGNFQNVIDLQFSFSWEPGDITFKEIKNINTTALPGANLANHFNLQGVAGGALSFDYTSANPLRVNDGTAIFQVCYTVTGKSPGELGQQDNCDNNIEIVDFPLERQAILSTSNGKNVGITGAPGNVCILNPTGFFLSIGKTSGYLKDTVCVDFKVANFKKVTGTQFKINWPTPDLKFIKATAATGITGFTMDPSSAGVGVLGINYTDPAGKDLADSAVVFTVCYELIGKVNTCHKISLNTSPNPSVTTVDGVGSVFQKVGEVCIQDTILLVDTVITNVSCPGLSNGTIQVKAIDGTNSDGIIYTWEGLDQNAGTTPLQFGPKAINLPVGRIQLRTINTRKPTPVIRLDTFTIDENKIVPTARAGRDTTKGCIGALRLNGQGSTGPDITYNWSAITGSISGTTDRTFTIVDEPGIYVFTVLDRKTGCAGKDTVRVSNAPRPTADAGNDLFLDCKGDTLRLDGSKSTQGGTIKYKWSGPVGTTITPSEIGILNPRAFNAGFYTLEARDTVTRCFSVDTVEVKSAQTRPEADAGTDLLLGCTGQPVTLDGSKSKANSPIVVYEWLDASNAIISRNLKFDVTTLGRYILRIVDEANGCLDQDTVLVKPSLDYPSIKGSKDVDISCKTDKPVLTTTVSNAAQFRAKWTSSNGGQFQAGTDTTLNAVVTAAGPYLLEVTNTASSCKSFDTVVVKVNRTTPTVDVGNGGTLTCRVPSLSLSSTSGGSQNIRLTWTRAGQTVANDSTRIRVSTAGTYRLTALDTLSGCSAVDSAVVVSEANLPQVTIANTTKITCTSPNLNLTGSIAPANNAYTFAWTTNGGNIVSGSNTVTSRVNRAGAYTLRVTNPTTGCVGEGMVQITADTTAPVAQAGPDQTLSCKADTLTLNGTGSTTGTKVTYTWTNRGGGTAPSPANALQAKITQAGVYVLTVRDTSNGCAKVDSIRIISDRQTPQASIAQAPAITCKTPSVQVTATGSTGSQFQITWKGPDGKITNSTNPLQINAVKSGTYELTILNTQNSCSTKATTTVADNSQKPVVQAVSPVPIACAGVKVSLNGAGSSTGAGITYKWTVGSGNGAITSDNTLTPQINAPGTYKLAVTNTENGCSSESIVTVQLDNSLPKAAAGRDTSTCNDEAPLIGNLPSGTTGQWTPAPGITVEMPNLASTMAMGLKAGSNRFIWSLSTPDCPNYTRDSLNIIREVAPEANNDRLDNFTASASQPTATINVIANDQKISSTAGFLVNVAKEPSLGVIDAVNGGNVVYRGLPGRTGSDQFIYQVCNKVCVDLCDTATVRIQVKSDASYQYSVPTGITPNGDGTNDELRFEILEVQPEQYKNNEIVIFNRWGDIVYRAKPYLNNWRGTNSTGQDLPTGTYYYILRLDISNGVIIKGDITIVK